MQEQIDKINKELSRLNIISIQKNINPETYKNLTELLRPFIVSIIATYPTQTYSTSSPTGTAPVGSIWIKYTGSLATNEIWSYSPTGWVQIK